MTSKASHDNEYDYDPPLLARLEPIRGEGFTSPGGSAAVDEVVERS